MTGSCILAFIFFVFFFLLRFGFLFCFVLWLFSFFLNVLWFRWSLLSYGFRKRKPVSDRSLIINLLCERTKLKEYQRSAMREHTVQPKNEKKKSTWKINEKFLRCVSNGYCHCLFSRFCAQLLVFWPIYHLPLRFSLLLGFSFDTVSWWFFFYFVHCFMQ